MSQLPTEQGDFVVERQSLFTKMLGHFGITKRGMSGFVKEGVSSESDDMQGYLRKRTTDLFSMGWDARVKIYDEMDNYPLVSGALDIYAEETTPVDPDKGVVMWAESPDESISKSVSTALLAMGIEDRAYAMVRAMCKYGEDARRAYYTKEGLVAVKPTDIVALKRITDDMGRLCGYSEGKVTYESRLQKQISFPWDYLHGRLLGRNERDERGDSILNAAYRPWRQLEMAADALLYYRIRRAPNRNMIILPAGDSSIVEQAEIRNRLRSELRRNEVIDPTGNSMKTSPNIVSPTEDVLLVVPEGDDTARVETLTGAGEIGTTPDVDLFRNEFFGALKIPKALLGFEDAVAAGFSAKSMLQEQNIRFAQTIKKIRRAFIRYVRVGTDTHLLVTGLSGKDTRNYVLKMTPINFLDELNRMEIMRARVELVGTLAGLSETLKVNPIVWTRWILTEFMKLPDDVVTKIVLTATEAAAQAAVKSDPNAADYKDEAKGGADLTPKERRLITETLHITMPIFYRVHDLLYEDALHQVDPSTISVATEEDTILMGGENAQMLNEDIAEFKRSSVAQSREAA